MGTKASSTKFTLQYHLFVFLNYSVILLSSIPYMCAAGSFAAMFAGLHPASMAVTTSPSAGSTLTPGHCVRLIHRPVPVATIGVVPIVAVLAVVAVSYPVIYEGSVLILTELADQLGFQGY